MTDLCGILLAPPRGDELSVAEHRLPALFPIGNRPILAHALQELLDAGVTSVVLAGEAERVAPLVELVASNLPEEIALTVVEAPDGSDEVANLRAAAATTSGPCVVHRGDALARGDLTGFTRLLLDDDLPAVVVMGPNGVPAGVQFLGEAAVREIAAQTGWSGALPDLADTLLEALPGVRRVEVRKTWQADTEPAALLTANRLVLEDIQHDAGLALEAGNDLQGVVDVDPTAVIERSTIRGPVVIGPAARVVDAYVGPFTSVGPSAVIENAEVEHSIILGGAQISHLDVRIESSVIGACAVVTRDYRLPRAMRLWIGTGARVTLS